MVPGRPLTAGVSVRHSAAAFVAVVVLASLFVTPAAPVAHSVHGLGTTLSTSSTASGGARTSLRAPPVEAPVRFPSAPTFSNSSVGSVVRTVFPGFNTSLAGSFTSSVATWEVGSPTYVPSTDTLWFPQRSVPVPGDPASPVAPVAVFNLATGGFDRLVTNLSNASALAYDPGNGYVYATLPASNSVAVVEPRTGEVIDPGIPVGLAPSALVVDPDSNQVFVANSGSSNVTVIDATSGKVSTNGVPVGTDPIAIVDDLQDGFVFVANSGNDFITAINATDPSAPSTNITLVDGPASGLAFSPRTDILIATTPSNQSTTIIDAKALSPLDAIISVGKGMISAVVSANGTEFVLGNSTGGDVVVLSSSIGTVIDSGIPVSRNATQLVLNPQSGLVYCWSSNPRMLEAVNLSTDSARPVTPSVFPQVVSMAYLAGDSRVFASTTSGSLIYSLDPTQLTEASPIIQTTSPPLSLVTDPIANRLYVGTESGLVVYNATSGVVIETVSHLNGSCSQLVLDRPDNLLWLVNGDSGVVAVSLTKLQVAFSPGISVPSGTAQGIAIDPTDSEAFVLLSSRNVTVRNSSNGFVIKGSVTIGTNVTSLAFDPADDQVYAAGDSVYLVDGATQAVDGGPVSLGGAHRVLGEAYDPSREAIDIALVGLNPGQQGTVTVLDGSSVLAGASATIEIPVGEDPDAFGVVVPGGGSESGLSMVWVANELSGTVSILASPLEVTYFGANPSTIDLGYRTSIVLSYEGGAGSSTVIYYGLPPGCPSPGEVTFNCTPSASGVFSLAANLTDSLGDSVNVTASLTVLPGLTVHVTFSPATFPVVDVGVALTSAATASNGLAPYVYSWSWGDGNGTTGADGSHAYSIPGVYVATAIVRDATGASANYSVAVTVVPRPSVGILLAPGNVTDVDFPVTFEATVAGGTAPQNETWTFGDATESMGPNVSHAWTRPGSFTVNFDYADVLGVAANRSVGITVHSSLSATFRSGNVSSSSPAAPGTPVGFTSNISGGTPPYELVWSFGDGSNATGLSVNHSYASAGTYTVRVTLKDAVGATVATSLSLAIAQNASTSGSISSPGGGFVPGVFLGLVVGGVLAAVVLFVAGRRKGVPSPARPVPPYVPP